jgi:hypothetical protein
MRSGLLVILIGILFLFKNLNLISNIQWSIVWPIILIYIGIAMVTRTMCWHCGVWHEGADMHKKKGVCDCDECSSSSRKGSK